jgi:hypothetical protein
MSDNYSPAGNHPVDFLEDVESSEANATFKAPERPENVAGKSDNRLSQSPKDSDNMATSKLSSIRERLSLLTQGTKKTIDVEEISKQSQEIQVRPTDLNEHGHRYAVVGGKPSQLPEHLWKNVRTDEFKAWFGDWEHIPVARFKTAKGSIYNYDSEGRTSRFKSATNEQHDPQDVTVFADLDIEEAQDFMLAYRTQQELAGKRIKLYVTEKLPDGTGKIIRNRTDIEDEERLTLAVINGNQNGRFSPENVVMVKRATLQPAVGLNTFDTRHFQENGETLTERHLGNKVVALDYEKSPISKTLRQGEPQLFPDPREPGKVCFIKSANPYRIDAATFSDWVKQFGDGEGRRDAIMNALSEKGYDGLFVDGAPSVDKVSGKPLFDDDQIFSVAAK